MAAVVVPAAWLRRAPAQWTAHPHVVAAHGRVEALPGSARGQAHAGRAPRMPRAAGQRRRGPRASVDAAPAGGAAAGKPPRRDRAPAYRERPFATHQWGSVTASGKWRRPLARHLPMTGCPACRASRGGG